MYARVPLHGGVMCMIVHLEKSKCSAQNTTTKEKATTGTRAASYDRTCRVYKHRREREREREM